MEGTKTPLKHCVKRLSLNYKIGGRGQSFDKGTIVCYTKYTKVGNNEIKIKYAKKIHKII